MTRSSTGPLRVAVLKFKNLAQNPEITVLQEGLGEALMDAIIHEPSLKQKLRVLERNQFDEQNLVELLRGKADYMDPYAAVEIGKIIGAEVIVQGSFEKQGNLLRVTTRITSLREGDVLDSAVEIVPYSDQSERLRAGDLVAEKIKKRFLALVAD